MDSRTGRPNPFYLLLVVVGVLFFVTAFAYGLMTLAATRGKMPEESGLFAFLDRHGAVLLSGELGVLALATAGAMRLDARRQRRADFARDRDAGPPSAPSP